MNAGEICAGFYPERDAPRESWADRAWLSSVFWAHQLFRRHIADPAWFADEVARQAARLRGDALEARVPALRYRLRQAPASDDLLAECFGLYCAAWQRVPAPVTLGAARALVEGAIVELGDTTERHNALALAAAAIALRGTPVHMLAASSPRARLLAECLRVPFSMLGIGVALVTPDMDAAARGSAYANLVVCGALRDVGFDYLRDRVALGGRPRRVLGTLDRLAGYAPGGQRIFLPGMRCALVEDADQVMLDDSRAPLSVTTETDDSGERLTYEQALELARALREPDDFLLGTERAELTPKGSVRLAQLTQALGGMWAGRERGQELIALALEALHLAQRDRDYRVIQGRVAFPPRPAEDGEEPDARQQLLQKLVEVKEGCRLSGRQIVLAQMAVPRMLVRYLHLSGTCGDARGLERDFWRIYRLKTVRAGGYPEPPHWSARLFVTAAAKRDALMECIRAHAGASGTVIALRTPAEAQALLDTCAGAGIKAGFIRGSGDAGEQQALASLAVPGAVIVTLYPAERAVPCPPADAVPHLVVAEPHDAGRHLRHIARTYGARSCEILLSLEDEALKVWLGDRGIAAASRTAGAHGEVPPKHARRWIGRALRNSERLLSMVRRDAAAADRNLDDLLAFSGQRE